MREYREALAAFEVAGAVMDAHVAGRTRPTAEDVLAEEDARRRLVAARRELCKASQVRWSVGRVRRRIPLSVFHSRE